MTSLSLVGIAGCFTGEAALGLPCETKTDCGNSQACVQGLCAEPGSEPCGNGLLNDGEECDDGPDNADDAACTSTCKAADCGDGLVGPGEACDDGGSPGPDSQCTPMCTLNVCGDGIVRGDELCDMGSENGPGEECGSQCTPDVCGDTYIGPNERCDSPDRSECTEDCEQIIFADDMEGGDNGWTHEIVDEHYDSSPCEMGTDHCFADDWIRTQDIDTLKGHPTVNATTFAWYSGNLANRQGSSSSRLISPQIDLREIEAPISLAFWHRYDFKEVDDLDAYGDGALVEISVDGGEWQAYDLSDYIAPISDDATFCVGSMQPTNPMIGRDAFVGSIDGWTLTEGALDAFAGSTIRLGFRVGTDCASWEGPYLDPAEWFVDNVQLLAERPDSA